MKHRILLALTAIAIQNSAYAIDLSKLLTTENINAAGSIVSNVLESNKTITPAQEQTLGYSVMANLLGAEPLVKDPALQRYVNQVGMWVASQSSEPNLPWRFGVIDSPNINSFAAAGGYILITRGLWDRLTSEAELAGVLGHEISHVIRKDQIRAMQSDRLQQATAQSINLYAEIKNVQGGQKLASTLGKAGSEVFVRGLDKNDEYSADINGMVLAARAGYNPYALVSVLQLLGAVNPSDGTVALMFSTHPSPKDRLDNIDRTIGDQLEPYANGVESTKRFNQVKR
ncbi:M48 family metalloprotease [Chitinibacter bivalviorum]|uniref:M48 family metalloprotease n=1 Tax=Chitinibacter bivalviorum TaxID=2739434 RepID=A0A7H9BFY9_9NEIS|nr:M48 family metalloprotease [Chitinibacter bivalviorum]QLG87495.1 M48 family metalloprotease [Chitinibacter bivalviorum]